MLFVCSPLLIGGSADVALAQWLQTQPKYMKQLQSEPEVNKIARYATHTQYIPIVKFLYSINIYCVHARYDKIVSFNF